MSDWLGFRENVIEQIHGTRKQADADDQHYGQDYIFNFHADTSDLRFICISFSESGDLLCQSILQSSRSHSIHSD